MARPRTELGTALDAQIKARTARGESADTIASALGTKKVSTRTLRRRQAELRGRVKPPSTKTKPTTQRTRHTPDEPNPSTPATPEEVDVPEDIPTTSPLEDLNRWLARLEKGARKAEADGNLAALASLAAKMATIAALKHRAAPLPKPDPNENPDFVKLAAEGEERLFKLVEGLFAPST